MDAKVTKIEDFRLIFRSVFYYEKFVFLITIVRLCLKKKLNMK